MNGSIIDLDIVCTAAFSAASARRLVFKIYSYMHASLVVVDVDYIYQPMESTVLFADRVLDLRPTIKKKSQSRSDDLKSQPSDMLDTCM